MPCSPRPGTTCDSNWSTSGGTGPRSSSLAAAAASRRRPARAAVGRHCNYMYRVTHLLDSYECSVVISFGDSVPWPPWSLAGGFENWLQHNLEECGEVMVPNYFTSARFGHLELELLGLGESEVDGINHRVSLAGRTCTMRTQRGWIKEGGREGGLTVRNCTRMALHSFRASLSPQKAGALCKQCRRMRLSLLGISQVLRPLFVGAHESLE